MSNARKAAGTRWESAVRDHAQQRRLKAFRPAQAGAKDVSDVHISGLVAAQCKDHARFALSEWVADAEEQAENAGLPFGVVVAKRRRHSVGSAYAVMSYDTLLSLVRRLHVAEDLLSVSTAGPHYKRFLDEENTP